ncbi:phage tail fiber protein [Oceanibaculum indicum]|uniref:Uncharacterized protein n=1 Tax=Oceanibaculum indicum P24 TaxID=1207063 RepID=K2J0X7_9PROT|nr:hypothetical protein [Oceanibaculum indicum]EKE68693.1 hypothetical protein P24_17167 [Oceanibaculum indicum P24]
MANFSTYTRQAIANWLRGNAAMPAQAQPYVSLWDGDPTDGGSDVTAMIRPAGRVAVTFGAPTDGAMANSTAVDFGEADGGASVSHYALHDAATDGNMLGSVALDSSKVVNAGDPVSFPIGDLTADVD